MAMRSALSAWGSTVRTIRSYEQEAAEMEAAIIRDANSRVQLANAYQSMLANMREQIDKATRHKIRIDCALANLDETARTIITLHYRDHCGWEKTARTVNYSVTSARRIETEAVEALIDMGCLDEQPEGK